MLEHLPYVKKCRHCGSTFLGGSRCPSCWKHQKYSPEEYEPLADDQSTDPADTEADE